MSLSVAERLFVLLTFRIINQGQDQHKNWTWMDLWNLAITTKLKDKEIYNSMDWSCLFLKFISIHNWEKCTDLQPSNYWNMYSWTFFSTWHDLIVSPLCLSPICHGKWKAFLKKEGSPYFTRERHYDIAPIENHRRKCIKTCQHFDVGKSGDWITRVQWNEVFYKNWNVVMSIRLWTLHRVSLTLYQIRLVNTLKMRC